jgi:hypothetical protein
MIQEYIKLKQSHERAKISSMMVETQLAIGRRQDRAKGSRNQ